MHFLLPADPFDRAVPDEAYAEEAEAFEAAGFAVSLFSFEDFESGALKVRPAIPEGAVVIYRGWMLAPSDYGRLSSAVEQLGAYLRTTVADYTLCHYLPGWYPLCADLTPKTVFTDEYAEPTQLLALGQPPYFVKDYVKSLTTARGSVAKTAGEVTDIAKLIRQFRGRIEGGICVREFVALDPGSEERFFVVNGRPFARAGSCPPIVSHVASRLSSPFYSVDVGARNDGTLIVIELGDGQVSDRKAWPAARFVEALGAG